MPTIIDCPTCTRKLNVPEGLLGGPVRCPDCGGTFEAGGGPSPPDRAAQTEARDEAVPRPQPGTPYSVTPAPPAPSAPAPDMRPCPYCAEKIEAAAVRCRFCGEDLAAEDERPWEQRYRRRGVRRDCEPHRGTLVLIFGILSLVVPYIGVALGIAAWVMGHRDLKKIEAGAMDPEGRGLTLAGKICGIVGTILQGMMTLIFVGEMVFIFGVWLPMSMKAKPVPVPAPVPAPVVAPAPVPAAPMPAPAPGGN
jgi:hypothetical protein